MSAFGVSPLKAQEAEVPWSGKTFGAKHNHSLSGGGAAKAASIANAILRDSGDEGKAIRIANSKVKGMRKRGRISDSAARKTGLDAPRDVDAATA
jgi:uncharacterized protein YdaT